MLLFVVVLLVLTTTASAAFTNHPSPLIATPCTTTAFRKRSFQLGQSIFPLDNSNINNMSNGNTDESAMPKPRLATLRIHGPDCQGIVAAFAQILFGHGCSIFEAEQNTNRDANIFFQRILFDYHQMHTDRITFEKGVTDVCARFGMTSQLDWGDGRKKVAILVSKYDHCLWELLLRHRAGELDCDIALIISNHEDLKPVADAFNVPFHVFKITKDTKAAQEAKELELMQAEQIDLVILARYMQIISDTFCRTFQHKVINIHHSFLPAFVGSKPYHRAHERGVKLIGATAHYATADLDEGPIIEQDTTRISHRDEVDDLLRKGRTLEKNVLVHAVKAHLEDRVIVYKNKCVVFGD
jgi:formyltetrahydrofolate deformylase